MCVKLNEHDTIDNVNGVKCDAKRQFQSVKEHKLYST